MAAHRRSVPLRGAEEIYTIEDGTMCRMPSPRPGPLRGENEDQLFELTRRVDEGLSLTKDSATAAKIGALPPSRRAA